MTDHKFTDDEIIKMLEEIPEVGDCSRDCIFYDGKVHHCASVVAHHALALINRQKAEIEKLESLSERLGDDVTLKLKYIYELEKRLAIAKAEAIKEFAENVKAIFECVLYFDDDVKECIINEIDELVKEMTETK